MFTPRLALLLLLPATLGQQIWYVSRSVLPAQDAVDFVSVAQRIEREGFPATVRAEPVPPLFPVSIAAAHRALTRFCVIESRAWGAAAQWAAAAALVLAVVPAYFFARRLVAPEGAFCGTLLFFSLPETARLGADGTSDALHLSLVAAALWAVAGALAGIRRPAIVLGSLAGICVGAALLVRSEGVVVGAAVVLFGLANRFRRKPDVARSPWLVPSFAAGAFLGLLPLATAGIVHPAEWAERLRGGGAPTETAPLNAWPSTDQVAKPRGDAVSDLGKKDPARSIRFHGLGATVVEFVAELAQASAYCLVPLAVVGLVVRRKTGEALRPVDRFTFLAVTLHLAITLAVAWRGGYLSSRHFLLPVLLMMPYAGVGVAALVEAAVEGLAVQSPALRNLEPDTRTYVYAVSAFAAVALCLSAACEPVHEAQLAHRQAARWLDSFDAAPGAVLDQQGFTGLCTGRVTYRFEASSQALADPQLAYVLLERADLEAPSPRGERLRGLLGDPSAAAARFADPRGRAEREVLVFRSPQRSRQLNVPPIHTAQQGSVPHAR